MRATNSCECDQQGEIEGWLSALKPGGRIQIADILLQKPVPEGSKSNVTLWTGCIAGGFLKVQLERKVNAAGFKEVEVAWGIVFYNSSREKLSMIEHVSLSD